MNLKLLHLCDSLFPLGGFAYSDGLEWEVSVRLKPDDPRVRLKPNTTYGQGRGSAGPRSVDDKDSRSAGLSGPRSDGDSVAVLCAWLDLCLDEALGRAEGPAVWRAWRAFHEDDMSTMAAIDEEVVAIRPAGATRRAARAMGLRLLTTWQALYPDARVEEILNVARRREPATASLNGAVSELSVRGRRRPDLRHGPLVPSLPVAFAVACASSGVGRREAVEAFVYTRLASTISAAMRLMPIGQTDAHTVLARTLDRAGAAVDAIECGRETIECFTPAMDIAMMSQQYLHSRLFRS
jgi:urease accessory protein UreF